jgi:hypothetical protein
MSRKNKLKKGIKKLDDILIHLDNIQKETNQDYAKQRKRKNDT